MKSCFLSIGVVVLAATVATAANVGIDPTGPWLGFMNVSELPSNGGAYVFGSAWGVPDLTATFSGSVLTLGPNSVNDPNPFWYTPSGGPGATGNKICDANIYQEYTDVYAGQELTFSGLVLSNTLVPGYTSVAFIKDFAPDYSSFLSTTVPLQPGLFSVTHFNLPAPGRHVQFGFETTGPDVWVTDRAPIGTVQVTTGVGDFDQNGHVNTLDVSAMMNVLTDIPSFAAAHKLTVDQVTLIGDLDGDSKFTNADLQTLLGQLNAGGGSLASVPEPANFKLLALAGVMIGGFESVRALARKRIPLPKLLSR